jgi:hypothetical protein
VWRRRGNGSAVANHADRATARQRAQRKRRHRGRVAGPMVHRRVRRRLAAVSARPRELLNCHLFAPGDFLGPVALEFNWTRPNSMHVPGWRVGLAAARRAGARDPQAFADGGGGPTDLRVAKRLVGKPGLDVTLAHLSGHMRAEQPPPSNHRNPGLKFFWWPAKHQPAHAARPRVLPGTLACLSDERGPRRLEWWHGPSDMRHVLGVALLLPGLDVLPQRWWRRRWSWWCKAWGGGKGGKKQRVALGADVGAADQLGMPGHIVDELHLAVEDEQLALPAAEADAQEALAAARKRGFTRRQRWRKAPTTPTPACPGPPRVAPGPGGGAGPAELRGH